MISITTLTSNENGAIILHEKKSGSELEKYPVRVSRSATLDGGAVIVHSGFSHGDRTLKVSADVTESEAEAIKAIYMTETVIRVSTRDGAYLGAMSDLSIDNGACEFNLLLTEKVSA